MWPWKKKPKIVSPKQKEAEKLLALAAAFKPKCPIPTCICYACQCRGTCYAEKEIRASGACFMDTGPRITGCSWNKHLKGELTDAKKENNAGRVIETDTLDLDDGDLWSSNEIPVIQG